jgi:hypothetical protein
MQVETDEAEIIERVAALDVGKAEVVCCVRVPGPGGQRMQEVRTVTTMTAALLALGDWLARTSSTCPAGPRPTGWTRSGCARSPSGRCCAPASCRRRRSGPCAT